MSGMCSLSLMGIIKLEEVQGWAVKMVIRERKNLPCTEWVNRGELSSGKGMIKQECDKH